MAALRPGFSLSEARRSQTEKMMLSAFTAAHRDSGPCAAAAPAPDRHTVDVHTRTVSLADGSVVHLADVEPITSTRARQTAAVIARVPSLRGSVTSRLSAADCEVLVVPSPVDVCLVERVSRPPLLLLTPTVTFETAVREILAVAPTTPTGVAEHLVRHHLPDAWDVDMLLGGGPAMAPVSGSDRPGRTSTAALAYAAAALIGLLLLCSMMLSAHRLNQSVNELREVDTSVSAP